MVMDLIRELWEYHHWANRRLFEVSVALGEEMTGREVGQQFSFPTLRQMFAHIYGGDWSRLQSWTGHSPTAVPGADIKTFGELRQRWDELESEQRRSTDAVNEDDLVGLLPPHPAGEESLGGTRVNAGRSQGLFEAQFSVVINMRRVYVVAVVVVILAMISGGLGAETQDPPLYALLPFNYSYPLIRVCRTDYGICLIPFAVAPGTPCECRAADGSWFPGVCIH